MTLRISAGALRDHREGLAGICLLSCSATMHDRALLVPYALRGHASTFKLLICHAMLCHR